eukprot:5286579-Amphidinium_carterae.1
MNVADLLLCCAPCSLKKIEVARAVRSLIQGRLPPRGAWCATSLGKKGVVRRNEKVQQRSTRVSCVHWMKRSVRLLLARGLITFAFALCMFGTTQCG